MNDSEIENLGPPTVKIFRFQIWVHGRQFPDQHDYWDGNWLRVTAHCGASGASVFTQGSILHLSELYGWCDEVRCLNEKLSGEAQLKTMEPYIRASLKAGSLGHLTMEVSITPEHLSQKHWFQFELDQSYLGPLLKQLHTLQEQYPLRGS